ncbi:hypothetical protein BHE74_00047220 [Ensete ventricosum]|uniref:Uncharacterized protein n=1 Tax=Ensete ventricosum TaxID=4639 RepID=A0A426YZK7_ENSVE|nr:hypothetical protein B296_00046554 [Ensete ventricosum]RWV95917.1 hypothetical protein GW17_00041411 [Ensete ventricosum]RWW46829.1 hypothetical protein BHE74_00047220 [Ensete ventricosum]RZR77508.1 hypothetical protein BHM03_00002620 [Ensete ventricosum]
MGDAEGREDLPTGGVVVAAKVEEILEDLGGKGGGQQCWIGRSKAAERTRWPQTPPSLLPAVVAADMAGVLPSPSCSRRRRPQTIVSKRRAILLGFKKNSIHPYKGRKRRG